MITSYRAEYEASTFSVLSNEVREENPFGKTKPKYCSILSGRRTNGPLKSSILGLSDPERTVNFILACGKCCSGCWPNNNKPNPVGRAVFVSSSTLINFIL